ncbi:hypothetical protein [Bacillus cereus]|uniref:hypothetical protein n=1 Tax=Bacillus cereus TaxID=1396 RepID=UPI00062D97B6|nr:hypothetical protein [Bacillus cereus]KLA35382.1 hypothetical protein B4080_3295 [Bacillus cereus]
MLKKFMVSSLLLTGILGATGFSSAEELDLKTVNVDTDSIAITNSVEGQDFISDGIEISEGIEFPDFGMVPFTPNNLEQNNILNAAQTIKTRYQANYNFSKSVQVKKTITVGNNQRIGVAIKNNKGFTFNIVLKSLSSGKTVTHVLKGNPTGVTYFGPMKAGNYVVTLVNTNTAQHQGTVYLGW